MPTQCQTKSDRRRRRGFREANPPVIVSSKSTGSSLKHRFNSSDLTMRRSHVLHNNDVPRKPFCCFGELRGSLICYCANVVRELFGRVFVWKYNREFDIARASQIIAAASMRSSASPLASLGYVTLFTHPTSAGFRSHIREQHLMPSLRLYSQTSRPDLARECPAATSHSLSHAAVRGALAGASPNSSAKRVRSSATSIS
jgi:hypothetical protein